MRIGVFFQLDNDKDDPKKCDAKGDLLKERKNVDAEIADVDDAIRENESKANHPEIGEEVALVAKQFIKQQGECDRT
jgi:hypothetical protein